MAISFAHLDSGGFSDIGRRRQDNEDAIAVLAEAGIFCVSDGVGGHAGGEIASQAVVNELAQEQAALAAEADFAARCTRLRAVLQKTNAWVYDQAAAQHAKGMGATVVLLAFDSERPGQALVLHAGDSRGYRFRNGQLTRLTIDHNMGNLLGEKSEDVSAKLAGTLTHAVGIARKLELSEMKITVEGNDLFLLCSDGLTNMLSDRQIAKLLRAAGSLPAAELAQRLIAAANEAGGKDNVSVIVIKAAAGLPAAAGVVLEELQVNPVPPARPRPVAAASRARQWRLLTMAGLVLLVLGLGFGWQWRRQAEMTTLRHCFDNEMMDAEIAFEQQDYDLAQIKTQAAAARVAADSEEGLAVRALQEKLATDQFDRTQRFATAIAQAVTAQAQGEFAQAQTQAKSAQALFARNRPEWQRAQALIDQSAAAMQAEANQRQADCATAIATAQAALEQQQYADAGQAAATAISLAAAESAEAAIAKDLQARAEAGWQKQRQSFTTAVAALDQALTKNDVATARQQAAVAATLCQPESPETAQLRDANDRIAAAEKLASERQQAQVAATRLAAAQAEKLAAQAAELQARPAVLPPASEPTVAATPIDKAKTLLAQQNYAEARKVLETMAAKAAAGTPEADSAKALLAQVEAGEQLMQQSMRFEAVLAVTRTALAQKDLVTAKQQADLALSIFPRGTPEWQQAQALANHVAKTTASGTATPPAPTPPAAASFGLIKLFKGKAGIPDLTNKTCYLRVNLWDDPGTRITTTNYHKGTMLPAGTPIKISQVNLREIAFSCKTPGTQYTLLPSRHVRESLQSLQHRYFTEQDPLQAEPYQHFTQTEKDAIRDGKIVKGMSKEAVLMAYGYPPSHKTATLEANAWFYWIESRNFEVDFQNGKVAELKEHPEGQPLW
jgi:protein phosphatase